MGWGNRAMKAAAAPQQSAQNILFAVPEVDPFSSSGGLGMVARDLPKELVEAQGKSVTVISPWYEKMKGLKAGDLEWKPVEVPFKHPGTTTVSVAEHIQELEGGKQVRHLFVAHELLSSGPKYGQENDAERFALFSRAIPQAAAAMGEKPDLIAAHDWQTGFLPLILKHSGAHLLPPKTKDFDWATVPTTFTIHRGEYFGTPLPPEEMTGLLRLPNKIEKKTHYEYAGKANPLWAGHGNSDLTTTVSQTYAKELLDGENDTGPIAYHEMPAASGRRGEIKPIRGYRNGIDTTIWNNKGPFVDSEIHPNGVLDKDIARNKLTKDFGLQEGRPILGIISRISTDKGMGLVAQAVPTLIKQGWNIVIGGECPKHEGKLQRDLEGLAKKYPENIHFPNKWVNGQPKHDLFQGADGFLIPSLREPCGLTQLEAQAYGTVPIVRDVGGLHDTVTHEKTGFLFQDYNAKALVRATDQAMNIYKNKQETWQGLSTNCLSRDFSWEKPAKWYDKAFNVALDPAGKNQSRFFA